ncbi:MAG TPA: hypothetical protein VGI10_04945 [Polyangiaceae bacterium]
MRHLSLIPVLGACLTVSSTFLIASSSSAEPPAAAQCQVHGTAQPAVNTVISDAQGRALARFSGGDTALQVSEFPRDPHGKARIETGTGTGSFRVRGFVDAGSLPLYTAASVPVSAGHVWIAPHRRVNLLNASGDKLRVEKKVTTPLQQTFTGSAPCGSFSLDPGTAAGFSPPGDARGYELKRDSLDLYDDAESGTLIATLVRSPATEAVLFFSTERKGAWVHIEYQGEVIVDAWAKAADLAMLPRGETIDQLAPSILQHTRPQMAFQGQPQLVKTHKEVALRLAAKDGEPMIGVIEPDTETYVLDRVAGWANVMPKSLNVVPPTDGQFWVKSADLGL